MNDLISRQAAIDDLSGKDPSQIWDTADVEVWVNALPSAQPEIIHCRDCKWHNREINQCNAQICASMCGEDFCSRAERREE